MHRFCRLLVGLKLDEGDASLIRYALEIAGLRTASEVRFVHVLACPPRGEETSGGRCARNLAVERMRAVLGRPLLELSPSLHTSADLLRGPLVDRLLTFSIEQDSDLILLGHDPGSPQHAFLARRLAMQAPSSIWMVPRGSPPRPRRILVPVDFSKHSADALTVGVTLARLLGEEVCHALHVHFNSATVTYREYDAVRSDREQREFEQFTGLLDTGGIHVEPVFEEGADVARAILRVAGRMKADLIVMPTRGRSRSAAILLGSVTERVLQEAQVPVLVVKHFGSRMGLFQALMDPRFCHRSDLHFD